MLSFGQRPGPALMLAILFDVPQANGFTIIMKFAFYLLNIWMSKNPEDNFSNVISVH